jgi:hypothetical protein
MIMFLPAINVDFPSNAFLVINKILLVATFDIPYLNMETIQKIFPLPVDDSILDAPDQTNLRSQLEVLGNSSQFMSNNLGSVFVMILLTSIALAVTLFLEPFKRFHYPRLAG